MQTLDLGSNGGGGVGSGGMSTGGPGSPYAMDMDVGAMDMDASELTFDHLDQMPSPPNDAQAAWYDTDL
jgi:catenin beta 1